MGVCVCVCVYIYIYIYIARFDLYVDCVVFNKIENYFKRTAYSIFCAIVRIRFYHYRVVPLNFATLRRGLHT